MSLCKKFLAVDRHPRPFSSTDSRIVFASCLDETSSIFQQLASTLSPQSFGFFTSRYQYNCSKDRVNRSFNSSFSPILISLNLMRNRVINKSLIGWTFLHSFKENNLTEVLHNCESGIVQDRNLRHSKAGLYEHDVVIGYISFIIYRLTQKLEESILLNSIYLCEGTTAIDIVLSNILSLLGVRTIVPAQSRIPTGHTLLHEDIFESSFLRLPTDRMAQHYDLTRYFTKSIVQQITYTEISQPFSSQLRERSIIKSIPVIIRKLCRYYTHRFNEDDHFNRVSFREIADRQLYSLFHRVLQYSLLDVLFSNSAPSQNDLVFFLHVYPERSVNVIADINLSQDSFILQLVDIKPSSASLYLVLHPHELRVSTIGFLIYLRLFRGIRLLKTYNKYSTQTNIATFSGSIILERALRKLPTFHCTTCYVSKGQSDYYYHSPASLWSKVTIEKPSTPVNFLESQLIPLKQLNFDHPFFSSDTILRHDLILKIRDYFIN